MFSLLSYMLDIISKHIRLLTTDFSQSNHPWKKVSKWAGYTGILYLMPIFFINSNNLYSNIYQLLWVIQTAFVLASDYGWGGPTPHILHGIDRLLATCMVLSTIIITSLYLNPAFVIIGSLIPLYFVYQSMVAAKENNWNKYVLNHTLWHITGPIIVSYALYKIQLTHSLFE